MADIKYNQPIEVSREKYLLLTNKYSGIIAGQINDNKYYIKVWRMKYSQHIQKDLL